MKKSKIINIAIILIFFLFVSNSIKAQGCYGYHKVDTDCRISSDGGFRIYGQSKSAVVEINKTFEYKLVLYGQKDYIISLCSDKRIPIKYKIINARSKNVLFDNSEDDYINSVGFSNDFTQSVIIEITIENEDFEIDRADDGLACVGVNIYWRKTPKIGF